MAFPYLFPSEKFGYKIEIEDSITPARYFNKRLLHFFLRFVSGSLQGQCMSFMSSICNHQLILLCRKLSQGSQ